jgi:membrane protease YdiL (CAAX protease family)
MVVAWIAPPLGGSPSSPGLGSILWGTAPMMVAVLLRVVTRDWADAGFKPAIRKNIKWYSFIMVAVPGLVVLMVLSGTLISAASVSEFSIANYLKMVLPGMVIFFVLAIFEEFGWRGYLVPKLASLGINSYLASAFVAVVWATWHLPYIRDLTWVYGTPDLITFVPRFYLMILAYSLLFYEIRLITGSVWSAVLLHSLTNAIQHPVAAEYLTITPGMEYLVSFSGLFMIAFVGLLGVALNRWRTRKVRLVSFSKALA